LYIFSLLVCFGLGSTGLAAETSLQLPADISFVTSKDGPYDAKYGNSVRHRMTVKNSLGGEGSQQILFEKFAPGQQGSPDKVIFKKELDVTALPKVKEFADEIAKKSIEATYGCCGIKDVNWNGYQVRFKVQRDSKSFACETTEFADEKFKVTCR